MAKFFQIFRGALSKIVLGGTKFQWRANFLGERGWELEDAMVFLPMSLIIQINQIPVIQVFPKRGMNHLYRGNHRLEFISR